ncbi:hypothetical protein AB0L74_19560 [Streptomyces sp. NPDC052020]|uniref:hypothetical protein n=1 Tax=Streptomyces sp. NPDC052020 TaxID=3155677 RepID=UPI00343391E1
MEAAARDGLKTVEGIAGRSDASRLLADRLRLDEQPRTGGPITDPVGRLPARGTPRRQECGDAPCDGRILLDSGRDCPRREEKQAGRRAQRSAVAAAVGAPMPGAFRRGAPARPPPPVPRGRTDASESDIACPSKIT